jgi:hypothetical protein
LFGGVSPTALQLNKLCGLSPRNGISRRFASVARKETLPLASANAGACPDAASQWSAGEYPAVDDGTPSHCSMNTDTPDAKPDAVTVKNAGFPVPSSGTLKLLAGDVIVPAQATPAASSTTAESTAVSCTNRRARCVRMSKRMNATFQSRGVTTLD